jgi:hypothetical protein
LGFGGGKLMGCGGRLNKTDAAAAMLCLDGSVLALGEPSSPMARWKVGSFVDFFTERSEARTSASGAGKIKKVLALGGAGMGKMDPQKRNLDAVERMVRSRQRAQARAEADDWLARGWNPFAAQEGSGRARTGFGLMCEFGGWSDWFEKHGAELGRLAQAALKKGPTGKLLGQRGALQALSAPSFQTGDLKLALGWGLDPNETVYKAPPPLFDAGRGSAELLLAAGADAAALDGNGQSVWERWLERACSGRLSLEDVKWMGAQAPVADLGKAWERGESYKLGGLVFLHRASAVARLMLDHGAKDNAFGAGSDLGLQRRLWSASCWADAPDLIHCLAQACGSERVAKMSVVEGDHAACGGASSVAAMLARAGHARCLGALQEHGLLKVASASELAKKAVDGWARGARVDNGRGLAWLVGRFADNESEQALALWERCAALGKTQSVAIAERLATRGWLPDSGPLSLSSIYDNGLFWDEEVNKSFSEFSALCERKSLKKTVDKKAAPKKAHARL